MDDQRSFSESIRTIRRELITLSNPVQTPELANFLEHPLEAVLDAWDEFEHAVGTAEGGEKEVAL